MRLDSGGNWRWNEICDAMNETTIPFGLRGEGRDGGMLEVEGEAIH